MTLRSRCKKCDGTKKIREMGNVYKQCPECKGVGYIDGEEILQCAGKQSKKKRSQ